MAEEEWTSSSPEEVVAWVKRVVQYGLREPNIGKHLQKIEGLEARAANDKHATEDLCDGLLLAAFAMTADPSTASSRPGIAVTARLAIFLKYCRGLGVEAKYLCKPADVWPAPSKNPKKLLDCLEACAQLQYLLNESKLPSLWAEEAAKSSGQEQKKPRFSHRTNEAAAGKKKDDNHETVREKAEEEAAAPKRAEEGAVVKKAEAEALAKKRAAEEVAKGKNAAAEAAGKKRAEDEAASRKCAEEMAAAKKLAEAEAAAKKRAEEEAASRKKAEEAVAAKRKAEAEAATKKRAVDAATASSRKAEDVAAQPAVSAKTQADEGSAAAKTKDEVAEKKKEDEKSQQVISNGAPSYMYVAPCATALLDTPLDEDLPCLQGYLWKRSPNRLNLRAYQRRFVVLKHFCIYWWRHIEDAGDISSIGTSDASSCRGRLDLEAQDVEVTSDPTKAAVFYVQPKQQWVPGASSDGDLLRTYVFSADGSEHSRRKWMEEIQVHIHKSQHARQGRGGAAGPAAK